MQILNKSLTFKKLSFNKLLLQPNFEGGICKLIPHSLFKVKNGAAFKSSLTSGDYCVLVVFQIHMPLASECFFFKIPCLVKSHGFLRRLCLLLQ